MKSLVIFTLALLTLVFKAEAQNPAPADSQKSSVLIMNATAHIGNGTVIPNSAIGFENGKLTLIADARLIRLDKNAYDHVIDAGGMHAYPGLIACNTILGLAEIDLVRATLDHREVGEMNPHIRSLIAYNTDSRLIPTVRNNGVMLAQVVPQGGRISGQSSVLMLDGWNWEDAAYKTDLGIHLNWPRMYVAQSGDADKEKEREENQRKKMTRDLEELKKFFDEARGYFLEKKPAEVNQRFEAMKGLFSGEKKLFVHCNYVKEIRAAAEFASTYRLKMVLVGGADSWRVTDFLKEKNIPVVITSTHALPGREDDDIDLPYRLPYLLKKAGVDFAISTDGSWQVRNLAFHAGTASAYGLTKEEALESISLSPAKILGIDALTGSLETGKDATLIISEGDILDMSTHKVVKAFIQGRELNLDDVQKQLNEKYLQKYGLEKAK
ncbi:MAG: amidohydrolase [Bacteroidetes bacterium]|nr:MAG: amidohydrolase [Bacteroidota bacterium]REK04700.1 MAG: amidohydrolase [Bacteroidota bacterium]REK36175.1 MAG: amidohydrolase [Bacteroidota bacterium]REK51454.1 MAG: amidohydrolase [Bacteroidota bacterium]